MGFSVHCVLHLSRRKEVRACSIYKSMWNLTKQTEDFEVNTRFIHKLLNWSHFHAFLCPLVTIAHKLGSSSPSREFKTVCE